MWRPIPGPLVRARVLLLSGVLALPAFAQQACPFVERAREGSADPVAVAFPDGVDAERSLALLPCLAHPDPRVRDGFAYAAYASALREGLAGPEALRALRDALVAGLEAPEDPGGFRRPFQALVLAEVARVDRIDPYLSLGEREDLVDAAVRYLRSVEDFRGFDPEEGWRHGVAHGADLLLQLALNPALPDGAGPRILGAVASRVAPPGDHAWVHGEPDRLARPVLWLALHHPQATATWAGFFAQLAPSADDPRWADPYGSAEGLAALHNTRAFARTLFAGSVRTGDPALEPVAEGAAGLLDALP